MADLNLAGARVAVIGLGRSGLALIRVLHELGARVFASDARPLEKLSLADVSDITFELEHGGHTERVYTDTDLVAISPGVPWELPILREARARGVPVLGEVELAYRMCAAPIIAITGTNGKSTTTTLIHEMLRAAGQHSILAGNIGIPMVKEVAQARPDSFVVAEISSFQLESIETFRPHVALALNVTLDHMDRHASMLEYAAAKQRIFSNQTEADQAIVNQDDEWTRAMVWPSSLGLPPPNPRPQKWSFSRQRPVEHGVWAGDLEIPPECPLQGPHNIENILGAACVSKWLQLPKAALQTALRNFHPLHHRMQPVGEVGGVRFVDDSKATNPGAVVAALQSMTSPVVVLLGGKDKGLDFSPLPAALKAHARHAVLLGEAADRLEATLHAAGYTATVRSGSFSDAVSTAYRLARPGDCVLLSPACASFDMFNSAEHRGEVFAAEVGRITEIWRAQVGDSAPQG